MMARSPPIPGCDRGCDRPRVAAAVLIHRLTLTELRDLLAGPEPAESLGDPGGVLVVVDLDAGPAADLVADARAGAAADAGPGWGPGAPPPTEWSTLPAVVVGTSALARRRAPVDIPGNGLVDLVVPPEDAELGAVRARVAGNPQASIAYAILLRGSEHRSTADGLQLESAVYGSLQAGPEFAAWRASHPVRERDEAHEATVRVERAGDRLHVTLDRPSVRNALNAQMRDELVAALAIAEGEPGLAEVHLRGRGAAFCAGGDLDEFGARPDVATAHVVRMTRSPARSLARLAGRVVAHLHGACMGSGIELPAFAGRVLARPSAVVGLPELRMGLIPGAGGTVSLPRRIGRHRTAWLGLTGRTIDVVTALAWGLVDGLDDDDDQAAGTGGSRPSAAGTPAAAPKSAPKS